MPPAFQSRGMPQLLPSRRLLRRKTIMKSALDCTSSRRNTVLCALLRSRGVITEYQSDSSSKRPRLSVAFAVRWKLIDNRSFHINLAHDERLDRGFGSAALEPVDALADQIEFQ